MRYYRIEKYFRGGSTTYYAKMRLTQKMRRNCWQSQLEEWGENTASGHCYGYRIYLKARLKKCPGKTKNHHWLKFNSCYLTSPNHP